MNDTVQCNTASTSTQVAARVAFALCRRDKHISFGIYRDYNERIVLSLWYSWTEVSASIIRNWKMTLAGRKNF